MSKKILVLDGHNDANTFCGALAREYMSGAQDAGHEVRLISLSKLEFDPVLKGGLASTQPMEPDLHQVREALTWCDHVTLVHPLWWGSVPAKLKGLLDRALTAGFAYQFTEGEVLPIPLLAGRNAHVMITSDTPDEYMFGPFKGGWFEIWKHQILSLCGITATDMSSIGPIHSSSLEQRDTWLKQSYAAGNQCA